MAKKHTFATTALAALAGALGVAGIGGAASAQTAAAPAPPAPAPTVTTRWSGSPETREEDRRFRVTGRFMYDVAHVEQDFANAAGTTVFEDSTRSYARRAFIGVEGRLTEQWRYNVKFDLTPGGASSNNNVKADDLYLEYAGQNYSIIIGNNNAVAPMEDRDSSLNIPFNERSFLMQTTGFGKRPGIAFITNGGNWSLGAALQSTESLDTNDAANTGNEPILGVVRGTWAPIYQQTPDGVTLLHVGATVRQRDNGGGGTAGAGTAFSWNPGTLARTSSTNASMTVGEQDTYLGAEFAFQYNSFGVDGEYGHFESSPVIANLHRDASADGYYVDFYWSPTGESRNYRASDGSFGSVRPLRTLGSDGGIGHIMLSARYENMDLTDDGLRPSAAGRDPRSELTSYTFGASWIPLDHIKFQLNYSSTDVDYLGPSAAIPAAPPSGAFGALTANADNSIDAITFRTQFDW